MVFLENPYSMTHTALLKNTIENVMDLMVIMGNVFGFNGNYNGVYWCVMDYIGGMLNHIGKMPKTHFKREFCIT